uniref:RCC1 and BTB domain-containing protein 2 n=2 Tax=Lygus hesperus TaxID=30085 RepID=A0A0A9WBA1_LYGHE
MIISRYELDRWELFASLDEGSKQEITEFFVFFVHDHGYGVLYKTLGDDVYGLGWNGKTTNLLGLSGESYRAEKTTRPTRVEHLSGKLIKYFCVDEFVGTALDSTGCIYWWGNFDDDEYKQDIRLPEKITSSHRFKEVSCGTQMIVGLTVDGEVFVWGRIFTIREFKNGLQIRLGHLVKKFSCGGHHVAMLAENGQVYTWGDGSDGQRGYRNFLMCDEILVRKLLLDDVVSIKCGVWCSYFLTRQGQVWACGQNTELGVMENCERDEDDYTVPRPSKVNVPTPVIDLGVAWESDLTIAAAQTASCLYTWGRTPVQEVAVSAPLVAAFLGLATPHDQGLIKVDSGQRTAT